MAVTRGLMGFGLGLLLADTIERPRRIKIGLPLLAIGAVTTLPLLVEILRRREPREDTCLEGAVLLTPSAD